MEMNVPNKLTILRICLIPAFLVILLAPPDSAVWRWYAACSVFVLASFTDYLDGKIARKYNLITNFGKFADPIADKLLVSAALIAFIELGLLPAWFVVVVISREFIISGFRLVAADNGLVLAASVWGKAKTVTQMILIVYILIKTSLTDAFGAADTFGYIADGLSYVVLALTIVSAVDYIVKNRSVLAEKPKK